MKTFLERLGVCSWSLQPADPDDLICDLQTVGVSQVQLDLDAVRLKPKIWGNVAERCAQEGIHLASGMFRTVGEDYASLQRIRETGGLLPDETWEDSWEVAQATAGVAAKLGVKLVSFHAGFIPHDEADPEFEKMLHRLRLVADVFAAQGIDLALETGQETALALKSFLEKLGRVNVGVNYDPANMLIYGTGNPTEALVDLKSWLKQCHIKDGVQPPRSGTLGHEAAMGQGAVNWPEFFETLKRLNYSGYLFIEREDGDSRCEDIRHGRKFLEKVLSESTA